jgi:hypothetical protein
MVKLKVGDLAIHDSKYPDAIYRVLEVDKYGNFRGEPVFRLSVDFSKRKSAWLGYLSFRKLTIEELQTFRTMLDDIVWNGRG